jgi:cytochrome c-type biogenesis protein CcmH/NrfG
MSEHTSSVEASQQTGWKTVQVYSMAVICLALGLALGYLFRGSQGKPAAVAAAARMPEAPPPGGMGSASAMPSLDQMKHMADTKAAPLLEKLKGDPNNEKLLLNVAKIYVSTHQFKEAAVYYGKALQVDPKDLATRTDMASCLYYDGDYDGALAQLQQVLQDQPGDANALFNLGMIKWKGKNDGTGAVAAWRELLKSNPKLEPDKKAEVQKLIVAASRPAIPN